MTNDLKALVAKGKVHWHVGSNIPGYMPEGDVWCTQEDYESALTMLRADFQRYVDDLEDQCAGDNDPSACLDDRPCHWCRDRYTGYDHLRDWPSSQEVYEGPGVLFYTSCLAWWVTPHPAEDCVKTGPCYEAREGFE